MNHARLYVVATPIGNIEDISRRALDVLASADIVAAEDTRHSGALLRHHGIERALVSLHEHNEEREAARLVEKMIGGESVALVSDAGTPLLSDPGYRLVHMAAKAGVDVVAVPGPSAITAALSVSGLPTDRFAFEGFLPAKDAARERRLSGLQSEPRTLVFFESSHRIEASLGAMAQAFGEDREAAVCRELTKRFETVLRGSLESVRARVAEDPDQRKGEFVVVVAGSEADIGESLQRAVELARELRPHTGASQAARIASKIHGVARREVYERLDDG